MNSICFRLKGLLSCRWAIYLKPFTQYPINEITFQLGKTESVEVNPKKPSTWWWKNCLNNNLWLVKKASGFIYQSKTTRPIMNRLSISIPMRWLGFVFGSRTRYLADSSLSQSTYPIPCKWDYFLTWKNWKCGSKPPKKATVKKS